MVLSQTFCLADAKSPSSALLCSFQRHLCVFGKIRSRLLSFPNLCTIRQSLQDWFWLSFTAEAELVHEQSLEKQNECWAGGGQVEGQ